MTLPNINKVPSQSANEDLTLPEGANGRLYGISAVLSQCPSGRIMHRTYPLMYLHVYATTILFIKRVLLLER